MARLIFPIFGFDPQISTLIQSIQLPAFDSLMRLVTTLGNIPFVIASIVIFSLILFYLKQKTEAIFLVISSLGALFLGEIFKLLIQRPRPNPALGSDSFPSGHVLFFMGLYGFLLFLVYTRLKDGSLRRVLMVGLVLMLFLIGVSRVYLGFHWFSDVLGSYLLGTIWLYLIVAASKWRAPTSPA